MTCDLCNSLPQNTRTQKRHERLRQIGTTERIARDAHAKACWVTFHQCDICHTQWRHVDDPCDLQAGWSVELVNAQVC